MRFSAAVDAYLRDMWAVGRITSARTERTYRDALRRHADDVSNRDPSTTNRDDVKRTLHHWGNPNSQRVKRSVLISFYDWTLEEGYRKDNPARQTRRPKRRPVNVYRLTREEVVAMLLAARGTRERRAIFLGFCAGLRSRELRGLRGRHFGRPGFVWVSADIAKGGRERWVPIISELAPIIAEITERVEPEEFVLPAQRMRDPGINRERFDKKHLPSSEQALWRLVGDVGVRAGIAAHIHPHLMRHAFADHIARYAGERNAQFALGHADLKTTETYLSKSPVLDAYANAFVGFSYGLGSLAEHERPFSPSREEAAKPVEATTGIEPV